MRIPILLAALLFPGAAHAASFDCAKAKARIEKMICGDPELSRLDGETARAYAEALAAWDGKIAAYVRLNQRMWVRGDRVLEAPGGDRGGIYCHDDKTAVACLRGLYKDRLALLRGGAFPLSGIYEKDGAILKLLATAEGLSLEWMIDNETGGGEIFVPVARGATVVDFSFDGQACRLRLTFTAADVAVDQYGACGTRDIDGRWVRNQARLAEDEMF